MALTVKMGVDISGFTAGIKEGQQSLKALKAEMKASEAEFKATGNAEQKMASQTKTLTDQLNTQKNIAAQAQKALDAMAKGGVTEADAAYQKMYITLMNAKAGAAEAQAALNALGESTELAGTSADKAADSLASISKKMSLEQVISGIDSITGGLENAAKKAIDLGEKLFSVIMDSAAAADDIDTLATRLGLTPQQVQQMMHVADEFEAPVESIAKTWKKVRMNISSDSAEIVDGFKELGVVTHEMYGGKYGEIQGAARDYVDVFWEVGEALMNMTDASEQERLAQKLLGRSWDELSVLFSKGRKAYEDATNAVTTNSEEAIENAAALKDRVSALEQSWEFLKIEVIGAVAPALEKGAGALATLIDKVTEYLKTDAGQELLTNMGEAVGKLFDDLANVDPEKVVENFSTLFQGVVGSFEWLTTNWETVRDALGWIVGGWAALELTGGALKVYQLIQGVLGLGGVGASTSAAAAGAAAGASWGGAFASAVMAAAPWLAGLITLLSPSPTGNNDLTDKYGNLTGEGWSNFFLARDRASRGEVKDNVWYDLIMEAGEIVETAANLWTDTEGIQALARYAASGDKDKLASDLAALGYVLKQAEEIMESPTYIDETGHKRDENGINIGYQMPKGEGAIYKNRHTGGTLSKKLEGEALEDWLKTTTPMDVPVEPKPSITWNEDILKQVGGMEVPVILTVTGLEGFGGFDMSTWLGSKGFSTSGNSVSSNLYVESMYMNNGTDAEGLAAAMAAAQRRTQAGFGS